MTVTPNDPKVWSTPPQAPHRTANVNPSLPGPVGVARKRKNSGTVVDDEGNTCDPLDVNDDGYCPEDES